MKNNNFSAWLYMVASYQWVVSKSRWLTTLKMIALLALMSLVPFYNAYSHNKVVVVPLFDNLSAIPGFPDCYSLGNQEAVCAYNQDAPQRSYLIPINKTYQCERGEFEYFDIDFDFLANNSRHIRTAIVRKVTAVESKSNTIKLSMELSIFNRVITVKSFMPYLNGVSTGGFSLDNTIEMCKNFTGSKSYRFKPRTYVPSPGTQLNSFVDLELFFTPTTITAKSIKITPFQ